MLGLLEARNVLAASLLRLPERPSHEAGLVCLASALETLVRRKVPANCPHTDSMLLSKGLELLPYCLLRLPKQGSLGGWAPERPIPAKEFSVLGFRLALTWSSELCAVERSLKNILAS